MAGPEGEIALGRCGGGALTLRMLHRRVRAGEHEGLVPVLMSQEIGRGAVPPVDLDDLGPLLGLTDDPPVQVQLVSDNCAQCLLLRGLLPM